MASWERLLSSGRPWVIAHRGFSAAFPENTMAAFEAAIEAGADVLELDVCLTGDGVPVVLHDEHVDRTTDGQGLVAYMPVDAVTALDAGSWFDPKFSGERVPTLEGVLTKLSDRVVLNLELRTSAFTEDPDFPHLEVIVADMIRDMGVSDRVMLSTFEPRYFARIERHEAQPPRVLLCDLGPCETDAVGACQRLGALALGPDAELIEQMDLLRLRTAGLRVLPWTINDEARMRELLSWGVDGIVTDRPDLLRRLVDEGLGEGSITYPA